ncbi:hypothetical protein GQ61_05250 [Candidatus Nucleicultrix amoebiphila FS5]|uniref:Uncharacterized protein n=1 Tax=Candidatus Nucleicultrix amoebiphila FS5 TaxID=1414854 RepID=A0A1W6N4L6_9PROT|nr:hypothetical protein GQ61_05250 [Candidatus Nucleicultrix amoebiphila FS5]
MVISIDGEEEFEVFAMLEKLKTMIEKAVRLLNKLLFILTEKPPITFYFLIYHIKTLFNG